MSAESETATDDELETIIELDEDQADRIIELCSIAWGEGIGPDYDDILDLIYEAWPEKKRESTLS